MKILYKFQEGRKGEPDGGEDRLVVTPDYIAVVDGATSKSDEKVKGKTMHDELTHQQAYYKGDPAMIGQHQSTKGVKSGQVWHDDLAIVEFEP